MVDCKKGKESKKKHHKKGSEKNQIKHVTRTSISGMTKVIVERTIEFNSFHQLIRQPVGVLLFNIYLVVLLL